MQWDSPLPEVGSSRTITKFAFFPISNGIKKFWLKYVKVEQVYMRKSYNENYKWHTFRVLD